ncbi:M23 family metallopeptidase [soil metagenome]
MAKIYYYYDPVTLHYKKIEKGIGHSILRAIQILLITVAGSFALFYGYITYFEHPGIVKLKKDIRDLEANYQALDKQLSTLNQVVSAVEQRDDQVYRAVLGTEPLDKAVRNGGVGGAERYAQLRENRIKDGEYIAELYTKVDQLKRKLYVESISQDELLRIAVEKQNHVAAIPAIQPISNKQLKALASGFGPRLHPFYKVIKMHQGIDFSAPEGTPVYATADGVIAAADTVFVGYGKMMIIDHGRGYQTRYAHLQDFIVKVGARVKRGEAIAYVGNTGQSTAPHLHYEVVLNGLQINPIHFFYNDLTPDEYEKIIQLALAPNQSMGN